ncbi:TrmB family transcriptional regulator sugar-binding domain-containing protein [Halobellus ruber]|uniref:Transcription regulator TrmB C-terminal domain-containing protein n=1 Tax=Halobellus ruber TaxID=2761102 RepID=A0A7J9SNT8_9EURY|nr:hypothetical protein [Halobellus ruber]
MARCREVALGHIQQAIESARCWVMISVPVDIYREVRAAVATAVEHGVTVRLLLGGAPRPPELTFPDGLLVRFRAMADTFVAADRTRGSVSTDERYPIPTL